MIWLFYLADLLVFLLRLLDAFDDFSFRITYHHLLIFNSASLTVYMYVKETTVNKNFN